MKEHTGLCMKEVSSYGLGLDQGVASIGWSIVLLNDRGEAIGVERLGVHLFEAGTEGDIERGRDASRAGPRRLARQARKQYRRRVLRKKRLLRWLQELGLMPPGDISKAEGRDKLLKDLDDDLRRTWEANPAIDHRLRQLLPYRLRAAGLARRLEPFELGRALYHLAQRRGYLSNRRTLGASEEPKLPVAGQSPTADEARGNRGSAVGKGNPVPPSGKGLEETPSSGGEGEKAGGKEDPGVVRAAIIELQRQMQGAGCKTLAEYFATLDPAGTLGDRLRGRWTAREMFLEEFGRLMAVQAAFHPGLTTAIQRKLHRAIFFQRPLQSASHLIGKCALVKGAKRCPLGHRLAQRFRHLQRVNDLVIRLPDFTRRGLTLEERERLLGALDRQGEIAFSTLKQKAWFGLPKGSMFNLEEGGEKKLVGNRTEAKCRRIFGDERWDRMTDAEKDAVVHDLIVFEKPSALANRGRKVWALGDDAARAFGECVLEPGFAAHSKEALSRLVPRMEEGTPYASAVKDEFKKGVDGSAEVHDLLPPVEKALGSLRNPAVTRALTELRKLVNAVVRKYGKPAWIRLELARDLKRARKDRARLSDEMRARERQREAAKARMLKEAGVANPTRSDVERVLLAEECGWTCPYTGRTFGMAEVIGRHPQVDVEHIWPLSRSLDDSFLNKTLCFVEENRAKGNRTPYEAYSQQGERWAAILERVGRFKGDAARIKRERFAERDIPEGFAQRHLAETRKIGAESAAYLGLLFGGEIDQAHKRRVFVTTGGLTAHLRREWHLNGILDTEGEKTRDDHRHHAVDALVVALTDPGAVARLQKAAEEAGRVGRRLFAPVEEPWANFVAEVRAKVEAINVSHRQSRRVSGSLHAATNYSKPIGPSGERRVRKELAKLTPNDIPRIVDAKVRKAVEDRIRELGLTPKKGAYGDFADRSLHPFTIAKSGAKNWIHKVRITTNDKPWGVGKGPRERFVTSTAGSNHQAVFARGPDGAWTNQVVRLIDVTPARATAPRPHGGGVLTLAPNEYVRMKDADGKVDLFRVLSLSKDDYRFIRHTDARRVADAKDGGIIRLRGGAISARPFEKVSVSYLGDVSPAGG